MSQEDKSESGFYCEVCECTVKDSINYLDHINGKRHNRNLGISLKKFTDSTYEEVKEMLELKKREHYNVDGGGDGDNDEDEDEVDNEEEDEKRRRMRREKKKRQKARRAGFL